MAEESPSPLLKVPINPLLELNREAGFLRMFKDNCIYYLHTDLWRFNGIPSDSDSTIVVQSSPYAARPEENDDYGVRVVDGTRQILVTKEKWARSPEADNVILTGSSNFCGPCYSALGYLVGRLSEHKEEQENKKRDRKGNKEDGVVVDGEEKKLEHKDGEAKVEASEESGEEEGGNEVADEEEGKVVAEEEGGNEVADEEEGKVVAEEEDEEGEEEEDKEESPKVSVVLHWNMMALQLASLSGCQLCRTLWTRCFNSRDWAYSQSGRIDLFWTTYGSTAWDGTNPGEVRLTCALTPGGDEPASEGSFLNFFRFQLWQSPKFDHLFERDIVVDLDRLSLSSSTGRSGADGETGEEGEEGEEDRNGGENEGGGDEESEEGEEDGDDGSNDEEQGGESGVDAASTRGCRPHARRWLTQCRANQDGKHNACNIMPAEKWRPTRLLDLHLVRQTNKVLLDCKETYGDEIPGDCEYITLSHCWGKWGAEELERLTRSKLELWQEDGIDVELLPPTFRDAIECASWFNVRWLWIDSMCIVQDSTEDWDLEAALMCEVYKNAVLNISADDSVDARGGCFKEREPLSLEPFKLDMPKMETSWWVTVDERSLFQWVVDAPLSSRAWVYQERQLSRRVLHFTKHEVFWECCAAEPSFTSESYPLGSPLTRDFVGRSKIVLPPAVADTLAMSPDLNQRWNTICEEFSRRALTYSQDKLPALAGLAKEFGDRCPSDRYFAGMWSSCLSRQLLWSVRNQAGPVPSGGLSIEYTVPSWSWLSVDTDIITTESHSGFHSLVEIVGVEYDTRTADPYARIRGASLTIRALTRAIFLVTKESPFEGQAYDYYADLGLEKGVSLFAEGSEQKDQNRIGYRIGNAEKFRNIEDRKDDRSTRHFLCMLGAITHAEHDSEWKLEGLLLEPTERENHFKRVGAINFREHDALGMRYHFEDNDPQRWKKTTWLWDKVRSRWEKSSNEDKGDLSPPKGSGPMSLYELDDGAEHVPFERLTLRELVLV